MNIRCSICMAVYNGEQHIYKQIQSILTQMNNEDEIIISDDYSTDKTILIIEAFNDSRIKIFKNEKHKGPVGNFENALEKSKGALIFFADQDDVWLENKLETHIKHHEHYDLVISDAYVVDANGLIIFNSFFDERGSKAGIYKNLFKNSYIGCCMSFNRRILELSLPFPHYIHMHDWWIGILAEVKGKVYFCDQKLMHYVRHQNNASPTLENSGYSGLRRLKNRLQIAFAVLLYIFK